LLQYGPQGADFDENDNRTAGHFAVPDGPCDSPFSLINATFEYIERVWKDKIDFVVWTGDNERCLPHLLEEKEALMADMTTIIITLVRRQIFTIRIKPCAINFTRFLSLTIPFIRSLFL